MSGHVARARRERFDICLVAGEIRPARLSERDHDRVDSRAPAGPSAQLGCPSRKVLGDVSLEDACLQEAIHVGITPGATLQRLDQNHGRDDRRAEISGSEGPNERECAGRPLSEATCTSAIENEQASTGLVQREVPDATHDRISSRLLPRCGLAHLVSERHEVVIGPVQRITTFQFRTNGLLEKFGRGELSPLQRCVEIVG